MLRKQVTRQLISRLIPVRSKTANKTAGGKCLVVAGSRGMTGAGVLAGTAAYRVGAGYVYLSTDTSRFNTLKHPEFLTLDYSKKIDFSEFSSVAIGPGLGQSAHAKKLLQRLLKSRHPQVVADADALNLVAKYKLAVPSSWILTPHEGELQRLVPKSKNEKREAWFLRAQNHLGCTLLLKGEKTLISDGNQLFLVTAGNRALAKAGTGDVLTGMIAGYMAQGLAALQASVLAASHHGKAAQLWTEKKDYLSMSASDLNDLLPVALLQLRKKTRHKRKNSR